MTKEQYIKKILRKIKATDKIKKRIRADIETEIEDLEDTGLTLDEIMLQKGDPQKVADEFNQTYSDTAMQKQYGRQKGLKTTAAALLSLSALTFAGDVLRNALQGAINSSIGIIGGADGPTRIIIASDGFPGRITAIFAGGAFLILGLIFLAAFLIVKRKSER